MASFIPTLPKLSIRILSEPAVLKVIGFGTPADTEEPIWNSVLLFTKYAWAFPVVEAPLNSIAPVSLIRNLSNLSASFVVFIIKSLLPVELTATAWICVLIGCAEKL